SDSTYYGGSNLGNLGYLASSGESWMGLPDSIVITLPPLAGIILSLDDLGSNDRGGQVSRGNPATNAHE
ncbi:MAG: hypothetical protein AAB286_05020, partial [Pseudomonadota bacterium]